MFCHNLLEKAIFSKHINMSSLTPKKSANHAKFVSKPNSSTLVNDFCRICKTNLKIQYVGPYQQQLHQTNILAKRESKLIKRSTKCVNSSWIMTHSLWIRMMKKLILVPM